MMCYIKSKRLSIMYNVLLFRKNIGYLSFSRYFLFRYRILLSIHYTVYINTFQRIFFLFHCFSDNPIFGNSSSLLPQPDWNSLCSYTSFQPSATFDKDLQAIDIDNDLLRFKTRELHENDMLMSPPS